MDTSIESLAGEAITHFLDEIPFTEGSWRTNQILRALAQREPGLFTSDDDLQYMSALLDELDKAGHLWQGIYRIEKDARKWWRWAKVDKIWATRYERQEAWANEIAGRAYIEQEILAMETMQHKEAGEREQELLLEARAKMERDAQEWEAGVWDSAQAQAEVSISHWSSDSASSEHEEYEGRVWDTISDREEDLEESNEETEEEIRGAIGNTEAQSPSQSQPVADSAAGESSHLKYVKMAAWMDFITTSTVIAEYSTGLDMLLGNLEERKPISTRTAEGIEIQGTRHDDVPSQCYHCQDLENVRRELNMANSMIKMQERVIQASHNLVDELKLKLAEERAVIAQQFATKWKRDLETITEIAEKWSGLAIKRAAIARQANEIMGSKEAKREEESRIQTTTERNDLLEQENSLSKGDKMMELLEEQIAERETKEAATDETEADESETGNEKLLTEKNGSKNSILERILSAILMFGV